MAIIEYDADNQIFCYGKREGSFTEDTKAIEQYMAQQEGWEQFDICHRISFYTMSVGIINALNYYCCFALSETKWERADYVRQTMSFICGVILSVKGEKLSDGLQQLYRKLDEARQNEEDISESLRTFNDALCNYLYNDAQYGGGLKKLESMLDVPADEVDTEGIINQAEALIGQLNNEEDNLRPGDPSFNRSLENAYDVQNMGYVEGVFQLTDPKDAVRITNLIRLTEGAESEIPGTQDALFFFVANGRKGAFVYGSTLRGVEFVTASGLEKCNAPILYDDYLTGKQEKIA